MTKKLATGLLLCVAFFSACDDEPPPPPPCVDTVAEHTRLALEASYLIFDQCAAGVDIEGPACALATTIVCLEDEVLLGDRCKGIDKGYQLHTLREALNYQAQCLRQIQ